MSNKRFFSDAPPWAKGALVVAGIAAVGFGTYAIVHAINKNKALAGSKNQLNAINDTVKTLQATGQKSTLDQYKLNQLSNDLFTAMDGVYSLSKMGTDTSSVYRAFTNVNSDIDVVNLVKAFGIKKTASGSLIMPDFQGTLSEHLTARLSPSEMAALNGLLARKGIKYRF